MADINQSNNFLDDVAIANRVNSTPGSGIDVEDSAANKTAKATLFSDSGNSVIAKILVDTGTYLKVKFLKNGKKFGQYKSRNYVQDDVMTAREYQLSNGSPAVSATSTLAITGTNTGAAAATSQFTATLTRVDTTTSDVSPKATWSSATPAHATVSSTGLVTAVATGASVITATYAGVTNTRTFTTS